MFWLIVNGHINVSFNPFIYPISHLTGTGKISGSFARWSGSTYPNPQTRGYAARTVAETIVSEFWLEEFARNLLYMSLVGVFIALGFGRFFENIKSRFRKSASQPHQV